MTDIIGRLLDEAEKAQRKGHLLLAEVCRDASDQLGLVMEERDRLREALQTVLDACDAGYMVERGTGGMTVGAQMRRSFYDGVPAWLIEEARAALGEDRT